MKKRILVTGANGQLGSSIKEKTTSDNDFFFLTRNELDLTNIIAIENVLHEYHPDIIINCAAYTAVDKAEEELEIAELINAVAPAKIASYCAQNNCRLIHISTDYVYNGLKTTPYFETDPPDPVNVYGRTKLKGERLILDTFDKAVIIRTSWVYSAYGNNFVKTMLRLMDTKDSLNVVNDQQGTPCYAGDLAEAILHIADSIIWHPGIFHYSNTGSTTWYEFAEKIKFLAAKKIKILPVPTESFPVKATRPKYSVLNKEKIQALYNLTIPAWEDSLNTCLSRMGITTKGAGKN